MTGSKCTIEQGPVTLTVTPDGLTKEKKRAVRRRAATLETEKGEVFLLRKGKKEKKAECESDRGQSRPSWGEPEQAPH